MGRLKRNNKSATDTVTSHLLEGIQPCVLWVFRSPTSKRQEPKVANLFVDSFIPRCHVITWPPCDRFQSNFGSANRNFLVSLELFILNTCPNHRRQVPRMIWFSLLDDLESPKIRYRTSSLVIRCFHEKFL